MGIIGWIVLGLLAGAIAKLIMPGDDPGGFIVTTLIGIAGALVGGFIASALGIGVRTLGMKLKRWREEGEPIEMRIPQPVHARG